jgi:hypothetical protein
MRGVAFDPDIVFSTLLQDVYPSQSEIENFFQTRDRWRKDFEGEKMFTKILCSLNPSLSGEHLSSALSNLRQTLRSEEPSKKVLATVAYLLQRKFGPEAAEWFWISSLKGRIS